MGTGTIFKRHNDISSFAHAKQEWENLASASPYKKEQKLPAGWSCVMELHNGNPYALVFWYGSLMRLKDFAGSELAQRKFYDKYRGKEKRYTHWAVAKWLFEMEIKEADRLFWKIRRKAQRKVKKGVKK